MDKLPINLENLVKQLKDKKCGPVHNSEIIMEMICEIDSLRKINDILNKELLYFKKLVEKQNNDKNEFIKDLVKNTEELNE